METKDIRELKKTLTIDNSTSTEIRCCYISVTEQGPVVRMQETKRIAAMDKNELLKYFALFGKLFATVDQKLFQREPADEDARRLLEALAVGDLQDQLVEELFAQLAARHKKGENIAIFLLRGVYDVPVRTLDNIRNDESDIAYPHLICALCPSKLTAPGLSFDADRDLFSTLDRQHQIKSPATGFIYPALTDREPDYDYGMIYAANEKAAEDNSIVFLFGCDPLVLPIREKKQQISPEPTQSPAQAAEGPDYDETAFNHNRYMEGQTTDTMDLPWDAEAKGSGYGEGPGLAQDQQSPAAQLEALAGDVQSELLEPSSIDDFQDYGREKVGGSSGARDYTGTDEPTAGEVLSGGAQYKKRFTKWASDGSAEITVPIPGAARMLAMYEDLGTIEELRALVKRTRG